jgi:hypothetical protein
MLVLCQGVDRLEVNKCVWFFVMIAVDAVAGEHILHDRLFLHVNTVRIKRGNCHLVFIFVYRYGFFMGSDSIFSLGTLYKVFKPGRLWS